MKKNIHRVFVANEIKNWGIKEDGDKYPITFFTIEEADKYGRDLAKKNKVEFIMHDKFNKIVDKDSYGNDPENIKDKVH